jgi:hypothetical protein
MGVWLFFVISLLGFFASSWIGSVVGGRYAVLASMAMFIITIIAFFTVFIDGFRSLADALPMLVEELRGRTPPRGTKVPQCLIRYFGGRATEVLSKLYTLSLIITLIVMYYLIIMSGGLASSLMTGPSLSLNETMRTTSLLFTKEIPTAFRTTVDITLGILGVVITVAFSLGSLLIGRGAVDAETLRVVHGVRFRSLMWFSIAIILIIVSIMLPPTISIVLIAPIILAITISLMTYLTLATTVIEHMRLPRGRPRRRPGRLRGPWG